MLIKNELKKIFLQLLKDDVVQIDVNGFNITVRVFDGASKLLLSAPVYFGGNFIPKSVRTSLSHKASFAEDHIKTFLTIDEDNFQVHIKYLGKLNKVNNEAFALLLEDFSWLAGEWHFFLDERDKNDLVHVRVK